MYTYLLIVELYVYMYVTKRYYYSVTCYRNPHLLICMSKDKTNLTMVWERTELFQLSIYIFLRIVFLSVLNNLLSVWDLLSLLYNYSKIDDENYTSFSNRILGGEGIVDDSIC